MKKMYIEIDSKKFEKVEKMDYVGKGRLYDCYNKPSTAKQMIWDYWCAWASNNNFSIEIVSYNCFMFTLLLKNKDYSIYVTPTHQYIKEL